MEGLLNIRIVVAHPEPASFNFALAEVAGRVFEEVGAEVRRTDLYQDRFDLAPGRSDFVAFSGDQPLQLKMAQRQADRHGGFVSPIEEEQDALRWADLLMLQFPVWWGTFPAVLKAWIERVLSFGFAYGSGATLSPRSVVLSVTTGGASDDEEHREYVERLDRMADDVFGYMGWTIHPHLIAHDPTGVSTEERAKLLVAHRAGVLRIVETERYSEGDPRTTHSTT